MHPIHQLQPCLRKRGSSRGKITAGGRRRACTLLFYSRPRTLSPRSGGAAMAMDFPVSPVDRLPIFPEEAASAAALVELIGGADRGEEESANESRGAVLRRFGRSLTGQHGGAALCGEETSVAAGAAAMSGFSESEGDIADAIAQGGVEAHLDGDTVIEDRTESGDGGSAQSTGKVDLQAPGWTKRVRVGKHPPDRTPCPERLGVLEQTIRGYAEKLVDHVVEPAIGLTFDSLREVYDFYSLFVGTWLWHQIREK